MNMPNYFPRNSVNQNGGHFKRLSLQTKIPHKQAVYQGLTSNELGGDGHWDVTLPWNIVLCQWYNLLWQNQTKLSGDTSTGSQR